MLGLLAPSLIALAAALACGGSLRRLLDQRFWGWPVIALIFGVELALYNPPLDHLAWVMQLGPWLWVATRLVFVIVLFRNGWSGAWGWRIAALGVALNTMVIAANHGYMPQSSAAALGVWGASPIDPSHLQNIVAMRPDTPLAWLGDVFAEPTWLPRRNVVSAGDILLAIGVAGWVLESAGPRKRPFSVTRGGLARPTIGSRISTSDRWSRASAPGLREVRRFCASNLWYRSAHHYSVEKTTSR